MDRREFLTPSGGAIAAGASSAVAEFSTRSAGRRTSTVDVPDFARGRWNTTPALDIVHM